MINRILNYKERIHSSSNKGLMYLDFLKHIFFRKDILLFKIQKIVRHNLFDNGEKRVKGIRQRFWHNKSLCDAKSHFDLFNSTTN